MSYTSLWLIGNDLMGTEAHCYQNSWLFNPNIWNVLTPKYSKPDPWYEAMGLHKSLISDESGNLFREMNENINNCDSTTDRICWELSNGMIFRSEDAKLVALSVMDFIGENTSLSSENVRERFCKIACDILFIDPKLYPYFVIHGNSVDDYVERWFEKYNSETGEYEPCSINEYDGCDAEVVLIEGDKIKGFVPMDVWPWEPRCKSGVIKMGYYEPDIGYYEPSEFDEKCEELMDLLRNNVTEEIKAEMRRLRDDNARMADIVKNYDAKVRELEAAKRKFEWNESLERERIKTELKKERLSKILEDFQTTLWRVSNVGKKRPKCDKCDKDRYIHFKSPSGKDLKERCVCDITDPFYEVQEDECKEFRLSTTGERRGQLIGWYRRKGSDFDYYDSAVYAADKMYAGQSYEEIENYGEVFFYTQEEAQKYADWLNARVLEVKTV